MKTLPKGRLQGISSSIKLHKYINKVMKMVIFSRGGIGVVSGGGDIIGREMLPLQLLQEVSNRNKAEKGKSLRIVQ